MGNKYALHFTVNKNRSTAYCVSVVLAVACYFRDATKRVHVDNNNHGSPVRCSVAISASDKWMQCAITVRRGLSSPQLSYTSV